MHPPPRLVYWELTKRCNLRCAHCRAVPQSSHSPDELSLVEGIQLIDAVAQMGHPLLVFTGGEPLLREDLFHLARHAKERGLPIALATNGTLVTGEVARELVAVGFQRVSISLDGPDSATHDDFRRMPGAFDQAVDGFIRLKELGMAMQVNTTVTLHNREQLDAIYELVRKLDAVAWHLFLLVPVGCGQQIAADRQLTPRDYEEVLYWIEEVAQQEAHGGKMEVRATCAPHVQRVRLQRQAMAALSACPQPSGVGSEVRAESRRGCLAGTGICFISHRGEVFPCGYLPVLAGNIRFKALKDIWETASVFADLRDPDRLMGKCGACEYRVVCGGCRARAFGQTGHYLNEEPFCNYLPKLIASSKRL